MPKRYLAIACGGVVGATFRWAIDASLVRSDFRWATFLVNVIGCWTLGVLLGGELKTDKALLWQRDFGAAGFCGGFTTMSTFAVDIVQLVDVGNFVTAGVYLVASVVTGFMAMLGGSALSRKLNAVGSV